MAEARVPRTVLDLLPVRRVVAKPAATYGIGALLIEDLSRRDAHAKHYRHPDGRTGVAIISRDLHYQQADGSWDDVDLRLVPETLDLSAIEPPRPGRAAVRTVHVTRAPCPVVVDGDAVQVTDAAGRGVRWRWPTPLTVAPDGTRCTVTAQGLTWEYRPTPRGLKLTATVAAPLGVRTFSFPYELLGGAAPLAVRAEDGALVNDTFAVPAPSAMGADGVEYRVGTWRVQPDAVLIDYDDTAVPAAAFPLLLDPTTTITIDAGADDGHISGSSSTWPPTSGTVISSTANSVSVAKQYVSSTYFLIVGLIRFNTSSLSGYYIQSATLRLYVSSKTNDNGRSLTLEWYQWTPPMSTSHWTNVVGTSANTGVPLANLTVSAWNDIPLSNPSGNINTAGYTGIRSHIDGGAPTGSNIFSFNSFEYTSGNPAQLVVTYITPVLLSGSGAGSTVTGAAPLSNNVLLSGSGAGGTVTGAANLQVGMPAAPAAGSTVTGVAGLTLSPLTLVGAAAGGTVTGAAVVGLLVALGAGSSAGSTVTGASGVQVRMLPVAVRASHRPALTITATTRPTG